MKKSCILLLLAAAFAGACSKKSGGDAKLRTDVDSVAYVIGMNVGMKLMRMDSTINVAAVCEGIRDVFRQSPKLTVEAAETFYLSYVNYALPQKALAYEEQFLADFAKSNRSYARTSSGVTYAVEAVGDQELVPAADRDSVILRYVLSTRDGRQLHSSYERGDSLRTTLGDLGRGVKEALKLIGKGGKIDAWIPSSAAYGAEGDEQLGVQPNATLHYEIELVEVDKYATRSRRNNLR